MDAATIEAINNGPQLLGRWVAEGNGYQLSEVVCEERIKPRMRTFAMHRFRTWIVTGSVTTRSWLPRWFGRSRTRNRWCEGTPLGRFSPLPTGGTSVLNPGVDPLLRFRAETKRSCCEPLDVAAHIIRYSDRHN
jgi:hypothetical protein